MNTTHLKEVPHWEWVQRAAIVLHKEGFTLSRIARCLGIARQTVRRWVLPGERERHNRVVARKRNHCGYRTRKDSTRNNSDHYERWRSHKKRIEASLRLLEQKQPLSG